jgi:hypothetical protein
MKLHILIAAGMLVAGSANAQMAGGDADAHGCRASAGDTWSVLKHDCIRVWETGTRLEPLKPQGTATYTATVIIGSGRAELFVYDHEGSLMLKKAGFWSNRWQGGGYTLTRQDGGLVLSGAEGQVLYREKK